MHLPSTFDYLYVEGEIIFRSMFLLAILSKPLELQSFPESVLQMYSNLDEAISFAGFYNQML